MRRRLSITHNQRQVFSRPVKAVNELSNRLLFVSGSFTLLDPAPKERGIEFETIQLILKVMDYLH